MSWITGVPPAEIIKIIREDPVLEQLSIQQIYNLKARYKQATLRNTKIDLMELVALCKAIENTPTICTWKNKNKERKRTYFREWEHW